MDIFDVENADRDKLRPDGRETWPRSRFKEADSQFGGEWNEFELSHSELLDVKLIWNTDLFIPKEGMTVADALQLDTVKNGIAELKTKVFPETHIWLAVAPLKNNSLKEYECLKNYEGRLIPLDGLHRLLVWAASGKQKTLAFIAGKYETKTVDRC